MTTHNYDNPASQSERKAIVTNERNTFLSRTEAELEEAGGRYARQRPNTIIANNPAAQYPRLPASSPWASPCPSGVEAPLGVDVNALGFHEARSTADLGEAIPPTVSPPLSVEASPIFSNKLRRL